MCLLLMCFSAAVHISAVYTVIVEFYCASV